MIRARCLDCGATFERDPDATWKKRCVACYIKFKTTQAAPPAVDPAYQEFIDNLRALIGLCHPDKHGGSPLATRTTQWLLSVKNRIAERVQ